MKKIDLNNTEIMGTKMNEKTFVDIRPFARTRKYVSIGNSIGKLLLKFNAMRARRKTIRELQCLSDDQLFDIGIPRYAIRDTVNNGLENARKGDSIKKVTQLHENNAAPQYIEEKRAA